ncbi:MAG: protein of unknown function with transrane region [Parcubacteria group bacterium]|nr:protein of unknown function with transrane region [Parcubacteria group bacterium]
MKKILRISGISLSVAVMFSPILVAAAGINTTYIKGYSDSIVGIINNILVPLLIAVAFIVFLWGIFKYFIYGADNDTERATGRQWAIWGIIGFAIIFSLWGLVNLLMGTLGLQREAVPAYPTIGTGTSGNSTGNNTGTSGVTGPGTFGSSNTSTGPGITGPGTAGAALLPLGANCTSSPNGCASGFCVPGDGGSFCSTSSTGGTQIQGVTCTNGQVYDSDSGTCVDSVSGSTGSTCGTDGNPC